MKIIEQLQQEIIQNDWSKYFEIVKVVKDDESDRS